MCCKHYCERETGEGENFYEGKCRELPLPHVINPFGRKESNTENEGEDVTNADLEGRTKSGDGIGIAEYNKQ